MFNGKGLKLYIYREKDHSDEPEIIDFEGMKESAVMLRPTKANYFFEKFIQNEKGENGVQLLCEFGYSGGKETVNMFPGDVYKYNFESVSITGPTDWTSDIFTFYLVLVKE